MSREIKMLEQRIVSILSRIADTVEQPREGPLRNQIIALDHIKAPPAIICELSEIQMWQYARLILESNDFGKHRGPIAYVGATLPDQWVEYDKQGLLPQICKDLIPLYLARMRVSGHWGYLSDYYDSIGDSMQAAKYKTKACLDVNLRDDPSELVNYWEAVGIFRVTYAGKLPDENTIRAMRTSVASAIRALVSGEARI